MVLAAAIAASFATAGYAQNDSSSRLTGLTLSGDQPIQIESDRLEVRDGENVAVFSGNVSVVQGATRMRSGRMVVHYARGAATSPAATAGGASNIERLEVDGKVHVQSQDQVATADRATFDMASEVLVMSGNEVVLTDAGNVIVGCRLTVQMRTGQAQLEGCGNAGSAGSGRVRMLLQPQSQNR